jgi:ribosome recycling factor
MMLLSIPIFAAAVASCANAFSITTKPLLCRGIQRSSAASAAGGAINQRQSTLCRRASLALHMSQEEMDLITMDADERMDKTMSNLSENLMTIRTGRANPNMLDRVEADYYGAMTPISQMATISVPSSQQLQISPFDKSSLKDIEKAIVESGLGFTPQNDGKVIRINIPQLTEERRKDLLKQCKQIGEEAKVAVRNIRRDGVDSIKKMEKAGDLGEDQALDGIDAIQKMTDDHTKSVDDAVGKKEKEVTTL